MSATECAIGQSTGARQARNFNDRQPICFCPRCRWPKASTINWSTSIIPSTSFCTAWPVDASARWSCRCVAVPAEATVGAATASIVTSATPPAAERRLATRARRRRCVTRRPLRGLLRAHVERRTFDGSQAQRRGWRPRTVVNAIRPILDTGHRRTTEWSSAPPAGPMASDRRRMAEAAATRRWQWLSKWRWPWRRRRRMTTPLGTAFRGRKVKWASWCRWPKTRRPRCDFHYSSAFIGGQEGGSTGCWQPLNHVAIHRLASARRLGSSSRCLI